MTIDVIVADDHPIFRDGLITSIEETGEFRVLGAGTTAQEAVALAHQHRPDIALLDLSMPGDGLSAARAIAEAGTAGRIVMLTVSEDNAQVVASLQAGATGYILKGISAKGLRDILHSVYRGDTHVSPALAAEVLKVMQAKPSDKESAFDRLTKREEQVLKGVAQGLSNREIGTELGLQEKTVKHYMTSILEKLRARNRVEAALMARQIWQDD